MGNPLNIKEEVKYAIYSFLILNYSSILSKKRKYYIKYFDKNRRRDNNNI